MEVFARGWVTGPGVFGYPETEVSWSIVEISLKCCPIGGTTFPDDSKPFLTPHLDLFVSQVRDPLLFLPPPESSIALLGVPCSFGNQDLNRRVILAVVGCVRVSGGLGGHTTFSV